MYAARYYTADIFVRFIFSFDLCVSLCICQRYVGCLGRPEEGVNSLDLELQAVVSHMM